MGLAGSTNLGARVMMGGQAGAAGHLTIGDGAQIAAQSGLHRDIPAGARYGGYPAMEVGRWRRVTMSMPRLPELFQAAIELALATYLALACVYVVSQGYLASLPFLALFCLGYGSIGLGSLRTDV